MSKKESGRERLRERWLRAQEVSGGPFRISAINRHRQFALLHAAAKARVTGSPEFARGALSMSKAARTEQWVNRLSPMALIEARTKDRDTRASALQELARWTDVPFDPKE
jgi:hypothetical protein